MRQSASFLVMPLLCLSGRSAFSSFSHKRSYCYCYHQHTYRPWACAVLVNSPRPYGFHEGTRRKRGKQTSFWTSPTVLWSKEPSHARSINTSYRDGRNRDDLNAGGNNHDDDDDDHQDVEEDIGDGDESEPTVGSTQKKKGRDGSSNRVGWVLQGKGSPPEVGIPQHMLVSSLQSQTVKRIQALLNKRKKRLEYQQTVVEGPRIVLDLLAHPRTAPLVQQVLVSTDQWAFYQERLQLALKAGFDEDVVIDHRGNFVERDSSNPSRKLPLIVPATPQVLQSCTDTVTPQGMIAVVDLPPFQRLPLSPLSAQSPVSEHERASLQNRPLLYVISDGVSDPGNMGTLIRSCLATGVAGLILMPDSCDIWNPKAIRSAMGTTFHLPLIHQSDHWLSCQEILRDRLGCRRVLAATMLEENDQNQSVKPARISNRGMCYYQVDWTAEPTALVIGNEGKGLSPTVRESIRQGQVQAVYVPMQPAVESLNAAVCASVILFEYARQCEQRQPLE